MKKGAHHKLGSQWTISTVRSDIDAISLRCGLFRKNPNQVIKRCVVFFNGRTEWIEKNHHLAEWLDLPEDCAFLTWDHRGQGASGGTRADVASYDLFAQDAKKIIEEHIQGIPYVVLSHSMGALIALYATFEGLIHPQSMALGSPLLRLPQWPLPNIIAKPISEFARTIGLGDLRTGSGNHERKGFNHNRLTHSFEMFQTICDSPYRVPSPSFKWIAATFEAISFVHNPDNVKRLTIPVMVLLPELESVVDPQGARDWIAQVQRNTSCDIAIEYVGGAKHELFSEIPPIRDQSVSAVRRWFGDFLA